jgi:hypothetical protein
VELARIVRYVEQNPVSAGLVSNPADWPWSSAGFAGESAWRKRLPHNCRKLLPNVKTPDAGRKPGGRLKA